MAQKALNRTPPLGFFKALVLKKDSRHKDSMNLKRRGTTPLTYLIRVHAPAIGSNAVNSFKRRLAVPLAPKTHTVTVSE
ncbi:MAG: hypothetical protein KDI27_01035 [Gammaproteobacteria bacterium]|nr:hypothetical protein [Gammaproteobacteria bacterium]